MRKTCTLLLIPLLLLAALCRAGRAQAVITETFKTASAPNWTFAGTGFTPYLTSGVNDTLDDGWLRLTSTGGYQATSAYYNNAFTAANATVYASFDYASWGGSGADGIVFFLFDGSKSFSVGANGGSLGYAQKTGVSGLNGGYLGIAVDEYGNFSSGTEGRTGGIGFTPDSFAVRGPGSGTTGYDYLGGTTSLATSIDTPSVGTRPAIQNSIQMLLSPTNQLTVTLQQGANAAQTVLSMDLSGYARPETLKFGFSSGTGALTNYHEVRNLNVTTLVANLWDGGAGDGQWTSANNWNPNIVPAGGADILFDNTHVASAQNITLGDSRTVRSLQFDAPFSYTISGGALTFDGGSVPGFTGIAVTQTRGAADQTVNSALVLSNSIGIRNNSTGLLTLGGTVALGNNTVAFDGTGTTTVTGVISGPGDVTKAQSGTVNLNAANTYSGSTTVSGGILSTNNNTGFGTSNLTLNGGTIASSAGNTISNPITLAGNGGISGLVTTNTVTQSGGDRTLVLTNATLAGGVNLSNNNTGRTLTAQVDTGTSTISGAIANGGTGAGSLTKTGFGTLTLAGNNSYTGTTTISEGTLQLGASDRLANTSSVNLAGGTLNLNGFSQQVANLTFSNSGTLDFGTAAGANYFLFANTSGSPSGVLSIQNWQSGQDVLASSTGLSSALLDQMYFVGYGAGSVQGSATSVGTYGGGWLPITPNTTGWYTWDSGNNSNRWDRATNWVGDVVPPSGSTTKVAFGTGAQTTVDLKADRTINAMRFDAGSASFNIGNSQAYTLTLDGPNTGSVAFIQQNSANAQSITVGTLNLAKNTVVDMIGAGSLAISSNLTGSANLVKENTGGTLILSANSSSYTGNIYVNAGTLQIQNSGALGSSATGTTTILDGGTLELSGAISSAERISVTGVGVGGAGAIKAVSGTSALSGTVTLTGTTALGATAGNTLSLAAITGANENLSTTGAGNVNLTGAITTGTGTLTIDATGTTTMTGAANTYTGTTTVNAGTLVLNKASATNAIAGNLVIGDGSGTDTVRLGASHQISDSARVTINSSGVFNLNGQSESIAALEGSAGASVTLGGGTLGLTGSAQTAYDGSFAGAGTINKSGTGKLSLTAGSAGLSGAVNLSGGILNVSGPAASMLGTGAVTISGAGNLELQGGATLANAFSLNSNGTGANDGAIQNIAGTNTVSGAVTLTGNSRIQSDAGTLSLTSTVTLGVNSLNVGGTGNTSIAGAISGPGGLMKDGSGTLSLAGNNTFGGTIAVTGGTLQLGASNVIPNAATVSLAAGTALDVNGKTDTFTGLSGTGTLLMNGGNLTLLGANSFGGSISGAGSLSIANSLSLTSVILNNSALTLNLGGTLSLGAFVNTLGTLNLTGNSILDFGNTSATVLNLTNLNLNGYTLTINNWVNTVDYFSTQNWFNGAGQAAFDTRGTAPMNQVTFTGYANNHTAWQSYDRQITPAPEPATYGAIFMGLSFAGLGWRRWRSRRTARG